MEPLQQKQDSHQPVFPLLMFLATLLIATLGVVFTIYSFIYVISARRAALTLGRANLDCGDCVSHWELLGV